MVEGTATNLSPVAQNNVVAARKPHRSTRTTQYASHPFGKSSKQRLHAGTSRYKARHNIAPVGINTASATAASAYVDTFGAAKIYVYLARHMLVTAHHYRRTNLPRKEVVLSRVGSTGQELLGCQIKRGTTGSVVGRNDNVSGRKRNYAGRRVLHISKWAQTGKASAGR